MVKKINSHFNNENCISVELWLAVRLVVMD